MIIRSCDYCKKQISDDRMPGGAPDTGGRGISGGMTVQIGRGDSTFKIAIGPVAMDGQWNSPDLHRACVLKMIAESEVAAQ